MHIPHHITPNARPGWAGMLRSCASVHSLFCKAAWDAAALHQQLQAVCRGGSPDPVAALPIRSRPDMSTGQHCAWMGEGA